MSKRNAETQLVKSPEDATGNDLAVATFDAGDVRGKEGLTQDDLVISRLAIAQKMSPEVDEENEEKYIPGLKVGDLFDSQTGEIYGPGPVLVTLIAPVRKHAKVLDKEGNVLEWNVPFDDPRCEFTDGPNNTRVQPVATRFYDFLLLVNENTAFPLVLSFKRSGVPMAKDLMTFMAKRQGPIWAGSYRVSTVTKESDNGPFKAYKVQPAGAAPAHVIERAEHFYSTFKNKAYKVADESPETSKSTEGVPF